MQEHIVKDGTFIPDTGIKYPDKSDQFIYEPVFIKERRTIDKDYPFEDKSFSAKFRHFIIYAGIFTVVFLLNPLVYGLKIKGKENIRKNRKLFKNGAITVCNHVYRWDFLAVLQAVKYRQLCFPARSDLVFTTDAYQVLGAGGIPLPETISASKKFNEAFDHMHEKKKWIHVFPESCRWDFYQPIRPFKAGAFTFAYKYQIPVIPMVISYRPRTGFYKIFKKKRKLPLITLTIGKPCMPDLSLPRKHSSQKLLEQVHASMVEMAGIKQNCWESAIQD
ncbi:MAG: 1-acyl-sn-glycerol-3-phosphate acyltransferase [Treponemataceae bacterium]|nr:1-acyl-sn-glycerol-3-phosphate acyltransferase [Treponemataceae bacterium]